LPFVADGAHVMLAAHPSPVWKLQVPAGQRALPSGGMATAPPPSSIGSRAFPPPPASPLSPVCVPPSGDVLSLDEHPANPTTCPHESRRIKVRPKDLMRSIYGRPVRPATAPRALDAAPVSSGRAGWLPEALSALCRHISIDTPASWQSRSGAAMTALRIGWTRDSQALPFPMRFLPR
jgi:hypothetical protein